MAGQIVDACCIINLYSATDDFCSLLQGIGESFHVPEVHVPEVHVPEVHVPDAVARESLYVYRPAAEDEQETVKEEIDLSAAVDARLVRLCDVQTAQEYALFVRFAADLDDGEAACLAIAQARSWTVATDDRKAQRLAGESGIAVVTTPELIKRWAHAKGIGDVEVGRVLQRIGDYARFVPRRGSVLHDWWMKSLATRS